jgi:hypothetical protein
MKYIFFPLGACKANNSNCIPVPVYEIQNRVHNLYERIHDPDPEHCCTRYKTLPV